MYNNVKNIGGKSSKTHEDSKNKEERENERKEKY
jgi:hypothetical protein